MFAFTIQEVNMEIQLASKFFGRSLSSPGKAAPFVIVNPNGSVSMNLDNAETRRKFVDGIEAIKALQAAHPLKSVGK